MSKDKGGEGRDEKRRKKKRRKKKEEKKHVDNPVSVYMYMV